tara:strand:+ start:344 stop:562 length:219 start_codon:yes stop_codon:yes gene_type:complete
MWRACVGMRRVDGAEVNAFDAALHGSAAVVELLVLEGVSNKIEHASQPRRARQRSVPGHDRGQRGGRVQQRQ